MKHVQVETFDSTKAGLLFHRRGPSPVGTLDLKFWGGSNAHNSKGRVAADENFTPECGATFV
jgi:hypothetical protein